MADYLPFTIKTIGNWPIERYNIDPDLEKIDGSLGAVKAFNKFRYIYNPKNETNVNLTSSTFEVINGKLEYDDLHDAGALKFDPDKLNCNFYWTPSSLKTNNFGEVFNLFKIGIKNTINREQTDYISLINPFRLYLNPLNATANANNTFTLTTSSVLISAISHSYSNPIGAGENKAYEKILEYLSTPNKNFIPITKINDLNLIYSISGHQCIVNQPIIYYSSKPSYFNPLYYSVNLINTNSQDTTKYFINPETVSIAYEIQYYTPKYDDNDILIGKELYSLASIRYEDTNKNVGLNTTYITNYDKLKKPNTLTFQLLQSSLNERLTLHDSFNAVLSCNIDLNSTNLRYYNYPLIFNSKKVPLVSGIPDSIFSISYMAESTRLNKQPLSNLVKNLSVGNIKYSTQSLSALTIPITNKGSDQVTWNLQHPPHYYTFKIGFNCPSLKFSNKINGNNNLRFFVDSVILDQQETTTILPNGKPKTTGSILLKNGIYSDFKKLYLDLDLFAKNDFIKLTPINVSNKYEDYKQFYKDQDVKIWYSSDEINSKFIQYKLDTWIDSITGSTLWIPATAGQYFRIDYNGKYGQIDLGFRVSLKTAVNTILDSINTTTVTFLEGIEQNDRSDIYFIKLDEKHNYVDLSVAHLTSENVFPFVDLRHTPTYDPVSKKILKKDYNNPSNISWNIEPYGDEKFLHNVTINAIDYDTKEFIQKIKPNQSLNFDRTTSTVRISGYGPTSTIITLYSDQQNQIETYKTNSNLFDYYKDKKFTVGLKKPVLNDINTKYVYLTGLVNADGNNYLIPNSSSINWSWSFDSQKDPKKMPIIAYYGDTNNVYQYGKSDNASALSSIRLEIKNLSNTSLTTNKKVPLNRDLNVFLNKTNSSNINGSLYVEIEDVPDNDVFNTDFKVIYTGFKNDTILDTRLNQNVLTRRMGANNTYTFLANTDVLPQISAKYFCWTATSNNGFKKSLSSTAFSAISAFTYNITNTDITITTVSLCAYDAKPPNWLNGFNIQKSITIYTERSEDFDVPLKFITFPPYYWPQNSKELVIIDQSNYTLSKAPTAYDNKVSNTQDFYLSANKNNFENCKLFYDYDNKYLKNINNSFNVIDIPYTTSFYKNSGMKLSLISYSKKYPESMGTTYKTIESNKIVTKGFNITAASIPFDSRIFENVFTKSPRLYPYNRINLNFTPKLTSIDLLDNKLITVNQTFGANVKTAIDKQPNQIVTDFTQDKYIKYTLESSDWKVDRFIPPIEGEFDLFFLNSGDPVVPLTVNKNKFNQLKLTASGNVLVNIPKATFDDYPSVSLKDEVLAFWNFDESSGTRFDATGNGHNLIVNAPPHLANQPLSALGIIGKSLSALSGVYLQCSKNFDLGSDWSLSYWQKTDLPATQIESIDNFITKSSNGNLANPSYGLTITSSPIVIYNNSPDYIQSLLYTGKYIKPYVWNHIVFTSNDRFLSVYINNKLIQSQIPLVDAKNDYIAITNNLPFRINGLNKPIQLDCMGIWKKAFQDSDVNWLYNNGNALQYNFNEKVLKQYIGDRPIWKTVNQNVIGNTSTIIAYNTAVVPEIFVSTYYALTGQNFKFEFESPDNVIINNKEIKINAFYINYGDSATNYYSPINKILYHSYEYPGQYTISLSAIYNTGVTRNVEMNSKLNVFSEWPSYNQSKVRLLNETKLYFGNEYENTYTLDQIKIQPNEFADVDIFNTAISRLYSNFEYIRYNSQTIGINSPTLFYGWLGTESTYTARGIQWNTRDYGLIEWDKPYLATSKGRNYFTKIKSFSETADHLLFIDGTKLRAFSAGKIPQERFFENINDITPLIPNPVSIESFTDESGSYGYVLDSFKNKIYKFDFDFSYIPKINVQLVVGNFGKREEPAKFNSPTQLVYSNDNVYVLDYGNSCIKQYTSDLNWKFTYFVDEFETEKIQNIAVHPDPSLSFLYVLTDKSKIYIFDDNTENYFNIIELIEIVDGENIKDIDFDEIGEFFYVITTKNIYKYTASGIFINLVEIPNSQTLSYNNIKKSNYRSLLISTDKSILKIQDIVEYFRIGQGLEQKYWTLDQLLLSNDDFAEDLNYNKSLSRLAQNIKSYRNIINSKFIIATENIPSGTITYFSLTPISPSERPVFSDFIEKENIGVGVNELHVPQILNREFEKIFNALDLLRTYLEVSDVRIQSGVNNGCFSPFCWSWKAMSCYNLSLPVIRICNVNPITYKELEKDFPIKYAPTTIWGMASSSCCNDFVDLVNKY
jgi:hypothetical protein